MEIQVQSDPGPPLTEQSASRVDLANALGRLAFKGESIIGAPIGGVVVASVSTGWGIVVDAVTFLVERVRMNKAQAEGSVNAYTSSPTYFPTYMIGMLEIFRIRESLRAKLGLRFTLKEFHERFLAFGNVPPGLIEAELASDWK